MIALDTNVLVYAHQIDSPDHEAALGALRSVVEGPERIGIPWPVAHEFISVTTNPRILETPLEPRDACRAVDRLLSIRHVVAIGETDEHLGALAELAARSAAVGPQIHDARIAAICLEHGVRELWTADRDFGRFPDLRTRNPLVG